MERRLVEAEHALTTGGPAVSTFVLPDDLGPLPVDQRDRALRVLRATQTMHQRAEAARDGIADALRQGRADRREPAAYLDTWA
jgi:hypothetical protein